jgi:hypothetical protein
VAVTLLCDKGYTFSIGIVNNIEGDPQFVESGIPTPFLRRRETLLQDKFLHVGWVREELMPYVEQRGRDPDMDISMIWGDFEALLKPETDLDKEESEDEDSNEESPDVENSDFDESDDDR